MDQYYQTKTKHLIRWSSSRYIKYPDFTFKWSFAHSLRVSGRGWVVGDPQTRDVVTRDLETAYNALGIRRTQGTTNSVELKNEYSNCAGHTDLVSSPYSIIHSVTEREHLQLNWSIRKQILRGCEDEGNGGDFTNI